MKSTHRAEVVPVVLESHPNADKLSIVKVWEYACVVRSEDWQGIDKGIYVCPDSLVPNKEPFEFMFNGSNATYFVNPDGTAFKDKKGDYARVSVRRFRGIYSMGLLLPAPKEMPVGADCAPNLGIVRYEPAITASTGGEAEAPPPGVHTHKYDVDALQRYAHIFKPDELVHVTEKIHGASGAWIYREGRMWCKSRSEWKAESISNLWWKALKNHPEIEEFCKANTGTVVYGEVYGNVQSLKYGLGNGVRIAVFDLYKHATREFVPASEARKLAPDLPWVPIIIETIPFEMFMAHRDKYADGDSLIPGANHMREGVVIKPYEKERYDVEIGRVQLKLVSNAYLEKGK